MNAFSVYNRLVAENYIDQGKVSYATVNRAFGSIKSRGQATEKPMLRYEAKFANDIWCADSSFGLYLYGANTKTKLCIIALIDDASRLVVSANVYDSDNIPSLLACYHEAVERFGVPKVLNVDNGKNYRSPASSVVNAKLGVSIHYDPVHTPTSKAKIERFFRTLKDQWMAGISFHDFHSIGDFQRSLTGYIARYNNTVHSSLGGLTPMQRYQKDIQSVIHLTKERLDDAFLLEASRKATFDSLVTLNDVWYQLPHKFARKKVGILYSFSYDRVYVIDGGERVEVFRLDKVANSSAKRPYSITEGR